MSGPFVRDLIALVADADQDQVIRGLIDARREDLGIRSLTFDVIKHPRRDAGCLHEAHDVLRSYTRDTERALVLLDFEGSGQESRTAGEISARLCARLSANGWEDRCAVIVIAPELENWVWGDLSRVEISVGWNDPAGTLRPWLEEEGLWPAECAKPPRPKEALDCVHRRTTVRRSASLFRRLAESVALDRCADPSFLGLRNTLRDWFPG